jgi:hypothetical protein
VISLTILDTIVDKDKLNQQISCYQVCQSLQILQHSFSAEDSFSSSFYSICNPEYAHLRLLKSLHLNTAFPISVTRTSSELAP